MWVYLVVLMYAAIAIISFNICAFVTRETKWNPDMDSVGFGSAFWPITGFYFSLKMIVYLTGSLIVWLINKFKKGNDLC